MTEIEKGRKAYGDYILEKDSLGEPDILGDLYRQLERVNHNIVCYALRKRSLEEAIGELESKVRTSQQPLKL